MSGRGRQSPKRDAVSRAAGGTLYFVSGQDAAQGVGVRFTEEHDKITRHLRGDAWKVEPRFSAQLADVTDDLFRLRPRFVHVATHGTEEGLRFKRRDSHGVVDDRVVPTQLKELFSRLSDDGPPVDLVVFNCCFSLPCAQAVTEHVPYAVGTPGRLPDGVALEFGDHLYLHIANGRSVEDAYELARNLFVTRRIDETSLPVLERRASRRRRTGICPFVVGRALEPDGQVGRDADLRFVLERIESGESVFIHGDPRIGKSSLLRALADRRVQESVVQEAAVRWIWVNLDAHLYGKDYGPADLWRDLCDHLQNRRGPAGWASEVAQARRGGDDKEALQRLVRSLERQGWTLILAIDEADVLATGTACGTEVWTLLRALAQGDCGLSLLLASRWPRAALQRRVLGRGSECFNQMADRELRVLADKDTERLLERGGGRLEPGGRRFVRSVAGRVPVLLQAAAQAWWYAPEPEGCEDAVSAQAEAVFPGMLDLMSPHLCSAALALGMTGLFEPRWWQDTGLRRDLIQAIDRHVDRLIERGLASAATTSDPETWELEPMCFAWWVGRHGASYVRNRAEHLPMELIHVQRRLDKLPVQEGRGAARALFESLRIEGA